MSAGGMAAERQRRDHHGNTRAAASARDNRDRAEAGPTVTVHVPLEFRQRRGRKVMVAPDGAGQERRLSPRASVLAGYEITPAMQALARAFRWRRLLETGAVATVHEIAVAESINPSYVSRVLRLTLIAPTIVESVVWVAGMDTAAPLDSLMVPFPIDWCRQEQILN